MVEATSVSSILNNLVEFELITLDICLSKKNHYLFGQCPLIGPVMVRNVVIDKQVSNTIEVFACPVQIKYRLLTTQCILSYSTLGRK